MTVFAITTIHGFPRHTNLRTVGLFKTDKEAFVILDNDRGDLNEAGFYPFAIVEQVEFGLYPERILIAAYEYERNEHRNRANAWKKCSTNHPIVGRFLKTCTGFALIG